MARLVAYLGGWLKNLKIMNSTFDQVRRKLGTKLVALLGQFVVLARRRFAKVTLAWWRKSTKMVVYGLVEGGYTPLFPLLFEVGWLVGEN